jgi:hypothetical protein
MSRLNKLKDSYQVLQKNLGFLFHEKKQIEDSQGMFKQIFLAQDFYHKHLMY